MNSTTTLTSADIRCLIDFEGDQFQLPEWRHREALHKLTGLDLIESMFASGLVFYRTTAAGRAEVKRAGGSK